MKAKLILVSAMLILSAPVCANDEMAKAVEALVKASTAQGFSCGKIVGMHELAEMVKSQMKFNSATEMEDFESFRVLIRGDAQKCLSEKPIREALGEK